MGNTPWPDAQNDKENPSIWASRDGVTWEVPPGVTNPLDLIGGGSYNSDTELLWKDGTLYLIWRRVSSEQGFWYRSSTNGVDWAPPVRFFPDTYELSPCLWWDGTTVHMWSVSMNHRGVGEVWDATRERWRHVVLYRTAPTVDGPWSTPTPCDTFEGALSDADPWHMGVTRHDGVWHMLFGVGELGWGGGGNRAVLGASSDGVEWRVGDRAILRAEPDTWQNSNIYRPSLFVETGRVRVWYSARSTSGQNRTAYAEFPSTYLLTPPD